MRKRTGSTIAHGMVAGASWNVVAQIIPALVSIVLTPFLIHGIGVQQFGIYSLALTVSLFVSSLDGGIGASSLRFFAFYAGRDDRVMSTRMVVTLGTIVGFLTGLFATAGWYAAPLFIKVFGIDARYRLSSIFLVRTLAPLIGIAILHGLFVAVLQAHNRFGFIGRTTSSSYVIWAAVVVVVVERHLGLRGLALALVGQQALNTAWIVPAACRYLAPPTRPLFLGWRETRDFFRFASRVQVSGLSTLLNTQFGGLAIGVALGAASVGLYQAGAGVAAQVRMVAIGGLVPVTTRLSRTFGREGREQAQVEFGYLQQAWVLASTGWMAAGTGAAYFSVLAWLGPHFRSSAVVCMVLLAGFAVSLWTGTMIQFAGAIGRPEIDTRYGLLSAAVNVGSISGLVWFGVVGAALGSGLAFICGGLYLVRLVRTRVDGNVRSFFADVPWAAAVFCAGATFVLDWMIYPMSPRGALGLLTCGSMGIFGMIGYAYILLGPSKSLEALKSLRRGQVPLELLFGQ